MDSSYQCVESIRPLAAGCGQNPIIDDRPFFEVRAWIGWFRDTTCLPGMARTNALTLNALAGRERSLLPAAFSARCNLAPVRASQPLDDAKCCDKLALFGAVHLARQ